MRVLKSLVAWRDIVESQTSYVQGHSVKLRNNCSVVGSYSVVGSCQL